MKDDLTKLVNEINKRVSLNSGFESAAYRDGKLIGGENTGYLMYAIASKEPGSYVKFLVSNNVVDDHDDLGYHYGYTDNHVPTDSATSLLQGFNNAPWSDAMNVKVTPAMLKFPDFSEIDSDETVKDLVIKSYFNLSLGFSKDQLRQMSSESLFNAAAHFYKQDLIKTHQLVTAEYTRVSKKMLKIAKEVLHED